MSPDPFRSGSTGPIVWAYNFITTWLRSWPNSEPGPKSLNQTYCDLTLIGVCCKRHEKFDEESIVRSIQDIDIRTEGNWDEFVTFLSKRIAPAHMQRQSDVHRYDWMIADSSYSVRRQNTDFRR